MSADVVVVGSCMTDLVSYVPRLPKAGETLHGDKFSIGFGGKGANQCVVAARLGAKTSMVAKVGDDTFGHNYIKNFQDNGVNIDYVGIAKDASTGVAPIAVLQDTGENSIIIVSGANLKLSIDDINAAAQVIQGAKVLVCQLEVRPEATLAAMKMAKKAGVKTILNPAPGQVSLDAEMYTNCDIFCPNETETELLTGLPLTNVEEAKTALSHLLSKGCPVAVITLGAQGVVYATQQDTTPVHLQVKEVKAVDTTGAGDAFVGSMAYYLALYPEMDFKEVLRRSCDIAAVSVQAPGTQSSYPWRKDLPEHLF